MSRYTSNYKSQTVKIATTNVPERRLNDLNPLARRHNKEDDNYGFTNNNPRLLQQHIHSQSHYQPIDNTQSPTSQLYISRFKKGMKKAEENGIKLLGIVKMHSKK